MTDAALLYLQKCRIAVYLCVNNLILGIYLAKLF